MRIPDFVTETRRGDAPSFAVQLGRTSRRLCLCLLLAPVAVFGQGGADRALPTETDAQSTSESTTTTQTTTTAVPVAVSGFGVAVLDTGVELVAPITPDVMLPGSASFVGRNPLVDLAEQGTHGTAVAQIIRTLSPESRILSLQTSTGSRLISASAAAQALLTAAANPSIRVINHSNAALAMVPGDAILAAALADQVIVMQSGNDRLSNPNGDALHAPGLGGKGIIVGALGPDGEMLGFSNRAGDYAQHYVVATGASAFADYWGTSFATPRVSALAAQLRQRWPALRAEEVTDIIKRSATDMGAQGVDAKYGWGRINAARAFLPLGALTAPTGTSTIASTAEEDTTSEEDAGGDELSLRRLRVGTPLHAALVSQLALRQVLALDRYGRDFNLDLSRMTSAADPNGRARQVVQSWMGNTDRTLLESGSGYQISSFAGADSTGAPRLHLDVSPDEIVRYQVGYSVRPETGHAVLGWIPHVDDGLGMASVWRRTLAGGNHDEGFHSLTSYRLNQMVQLDVSLADTHDSEELDQGNQQWASAIHLQNDTFGASIEGGILAEEGSLYGSAPGGALSVASAKTRYFRVSGYGRINGHLAVIAAFSAALTEVNEAKGKLLDDFSDLTAKSWLVGLGAKGVFSKRDGASLTVSQPLKVTDGSADLDVPYELGSGGRVLRYQERIGLAPSGSETSLELTYRIKWSKSLELGAYGAMRYEAGHNPQLGFRTELATVVRGTF